jgi:hypothetical protein
VVFPQPDGPEKGDELAVRDGERDLWSARNVAKSLAIRSMAMSAMGDDPQFKNPNVLMLRCEGRQGLSLEARNHLSVAPAASTTAGVLRGSLRSHLRMRRWGRSFSLGRSLAGMPQTANR